MLTFEKVVEVLYTACKDRSLTSKDVFHKVIADLQLIGASHLEAQAIEIIRPYKQTGKNLEKTAKELYTLLDTKNSEPEWNKTTWG